MSPPLDPRIKEYAKSFGGNLSLWALGLSVFAFKAWQWYFAFPGDADIAIVGGLLRLKVSYLASVVTFVFGWLVGVYSLKNLQQVMIHFFRPLELVSDAETKDFFAAPATVLFSLALLLFVLDTVTANIAFKITSRYEVFLSLPKGNGTFLILSDGKMAERTALKPEQTVRLALRGRDDSQVLLVRDQYNLVTLDALNFHRGSFGSRVERSTLVAIHPGASLEGPIRPPKLTGLYETEFTGPLRFSPTKVATTITPLGQPIKHGGWVQPGTGSECPERSGPAYARKFFEVLCDNRKTFATWETTPAYHETIEGTPATVVYHAIGPYDLVVRFEEARAVIQGDSFDTREAKEVIATEKATK